MPVVTFQRADLCKLIGKEYSTDELAERMPMMGGDLDKVAGDAITIEWFPDRPDLLSLEGTGRALRAFFDVKPGLPTYAVAKATTELTVDASVQGVRPHAALCFVRGVPIDDDYVANIMEAQEKITLAPGRKRRKIAIGVHDASGLEGPFTYTCVGPNDKPFVPLAMTHAMTPADIVAKHPKGKEYGHLVSDAFPVFLDGAGDVLSMPPIINAAKTTVTGTTQDLLLDVTGTDATSVRRTIALLATGFAERGGRIESVTVHDASGSWNCPDLSTSEQVLHADDVQKLMGIELAGPDIAKALERMGHKAEAFDNRILVEVASWRFDILHPVDLMEDVAIGYGFENFQGHLPATVTFGGPLPHQAKEDRLRELLLASGFQEARTLTLSNEHDQWTAWGHPVPDAVTLHNPVLEEQTLLRQRLVPSLLRVLAANRHRPLPQRLFELGYTVNADGNNQLHLALVECDAKTGFHVAKGLAELLASELGGELKPATEPGFIAGRQGTAGNGHFGELHPDTLVAFGLGAATIALEWQL